MENTESQLWWFWIIRALGGNGSAPHPRQSQHGSVPESGFNKNPEFVHPDTEF